MNDRKPGHSYPDGLKNATGPTIRSSIPHSISSLPKPPPIAAGVGEPRMRKGGGRWPKWNDD